MRDNFTTLHLVGETIDAKRAHQRAQAGEILQLVRGVYVDQAADVDAAILDHAIRIAHYLYPNAYLSSASAALLARHRMGGCSSAVDAISAPGCPTSRSFRTKHHNILPRQRQSWAMVWANCGFQCLPPVSAFSNHFRLRSAHASAITSDMRAQMAARLVVELGTPKAVADAIWALARENNWYREGEGAQRYLLTQPGAAKPPVKKGGAGSAGWLAC